MGSFGCCCSLNCLVMPRVPGVEQKQSATNSIISPFKDLSPSTKKHWPQLDISGWRTSFYWLSCWREVWSREYVPVQTHRVTWQHMLCQVNSSPSSSVWQMNYVICLKKTLEVKTLRMDKQQYHLLTPAIAAPWQSIPLVDILQSTLILCQATKQKAP